MLKNKKILYIFMFLLTFLLFISTNSFASTGNEDTDSIIKNNFLLLKKYVNENYGEFNDYVICGTSGLDCGSYGVFILNPDGGYCRNNGKGAFHSNYSVIFQISGTTLYDENTTFSAMVDHWNSAPNASTYYNGCVQYTVFSTVVIDGTDCIDVLDLTVDTPTETPQEVRGTIAPIAKEMKMETVLQEIVGILPLIIVVVVSFLGLRKALRLLLTLLRKA